MTINPIDGNVISQVRFDVIDKSASDFLLDKGYIRKHYQTPSRNDYKFLIKDNIMEFLKVFKERLIEITCDEFSKKFKNTSL